jgi:hypothetical protein
MGSQECEETLETLKFSDGVKFDLTGPLRIETRSDGLYVVGKGLLMAVDSLEEGEKFIKEIEACREATGDPNGGE